MTPVFLDRIFLFFERRGIFSRKPTKEQGVMIFFLLLVLSLIGRIFFLQILQVDYYRNQLSKQHSSKVDITAKRGEIYVYDDAGQAIPLATNADLYNMFIDPKFIWDAGRVTDILTPILYDHFCVTYGLDSVDKETCITNIESFTKTTILPRLKVVHYSYTTGDIASALSGLQDQQIVVDQENNDIENQRKEIITAFTREEGYNRIHEQLVTMLTPGKKSQNYLGFFDSPALLDAIHTNNYPYISILNNYYIYISPDNVGDINKRAIELSNLLTSYGYNYTTEKLIPLFSKQDTRYVKITDGINATYAQKIKKAISDNYNIKSTCTETNNASCEKGVPLLHGVGLEEIKKRYYPLGTFASNVLGYITPQGDALYGIEQYYESLLQGKPGQIRGLSTPWIGEVGSNEVSIINPVDGGDVYLTIQPFVQKKVENLISHYITEFNADSIAVLVMDPYSGNIIASANAPTFNPNHPEESYALRALTPQDAYIVDNDSFVDIPIYYSSGNKLLNATYNDRKNSTLEKYIAKNYLGPQVFIDKNISFPYEPGSIIKPFTVSAGLDNDEISLYDFYSDPESQVTIDLGDGTSQYIRNADKTHCIGTHTFLHALTYSCNVGMVRIAQQLQKEAFFNYMERFGFGRLTNVELAGESAGFLDTASSAGLARFFNTSFGQGMLATPMQIAAGYSAIINGGYYVKPRIVDKIYDPKTKAYTVNPIKVGAQILKPETSEKMRDALFQVVYGGLTKQFGIPGYTLGGKSGTSQIAFRGVYRSGNGRTNASFVGMITKNNLKYIVVIQIRRPRTSQFGEYTAGKVFGDLSKILIERDHIQE